VNHILGLAALAAIVLAYGAIEVGIGLLIRKFIKNAWRQISEQYDRANRPKQ
jgi:hypothetical protein